MKLIIIMHSKCESSDNFQSLYNLFYILVSDICYDYYAIFYDICFISLVLQCTLGLTNVFAGAPRAVALALPIFQFQSTWILELTLHLFSEIEAEIFYTR